MAGTKLTIKERMARLLGKQKARGEEFSRVSPAVETNPVPLEGPKEPEVQEVVQEPVEKRKTLKGTVPRLLLGGLYTPTLHECGEPEVVISWGKRPAGSKGGLRVVGSEDDSKDARFFKQLMTAEGQLREHSLALEDGPYADKEGQVKELARELGRGTENQTEIMDRAVDIFRPFISVESELVVPRIHRVPLQFMLNQNYARVPDTLPTAGEILSQRGVRLTNDPTSGADMFIMAHHMEAYVLAAAALRMCGLRAYPSLGVVSSGVAGEGYSNIITVVHPEKEAPITTFGLVRPHPPMGSIDIMSDTAVMGILHLMQAETRIKHLTTKMVELSKSGEKLNETQIAVELKRIAELLFECHLSWAGTHFISEALAYLAQDVHDAVMSSQMGNLPKILEQHPELASNPIVLESMMGDNALGAASLFADNTRQYLTMLIVEHSEV